MLMLRGLLPELEDMDMAPPWPVLVKLWPLPECDADAEDEPEGIPAQTRHALHHTAPLSSKDTVLKPQGSAL